MTDTDREPPAPASESDDALTLPLRWENDRAIGGWWLMAGPLDIGSVYEMCDGGFDWASGTLTKGARGEARTLEAAKAALIAEVRRQVEPD